jgi:hypothetical protein
MGTVSYMFLEQKHGIQSFTANNFFVCLCRNAYATYGNCVLYVLLFTTLQNTIFYLLTTTVNHNSSRAVYTTVVISVNFYYYV